MINTIPKELIHIICTNLDSKDIALLASINNYLQSIITKFIFSHEITYYLHPTFITSGWQKCFDSYIIANKTISNEIIAKMTHIRSLVINYCTVADNYLFIKLLSLQKLILILKDDTDTKLNIIESQNLTQLVLNGRIKQCFSSRQSTQMIWKHLTVFAWGYCNDIWYSMMDIRSYIEKTPILNDLTIYWNDHYKYDLDRICKIICQHKTLQTINVIDPIKRPSALEFVTKIKNVGKQITVITNNI